SYHPSCAQFVPRPSCVPRRRSTMLLTQKSSPTAVPQIMASAAQPGNLRAVLQQPDFRKLWLAQFVSIFGDFLALFGVISLITFRWHGNAVQVTFVLVAYMLPFALVGPL